MLSEGKVGPVRRSDGSIGELRTGKDGEIIFSAAHGNYYEAVARGKCFTAATAVTGVAHGTALGTTVPWCLWNPPNSGVNLVMLKTRLAYVSGTLGAGMLVYCTQTQATTPTGTAISSINALLASAATGVGVAKTSMVITTTPVQVFPMCSYGPILATTAVPPWLATDWLDGELILAPGGVLGLQGVGTAGTSPLVVISGTWEEVPI